MVNSSSFSAFLQVDLKWEMDIDSLMTLYVQYHIVLYVPWDRTCPCTRMIFLISCVWALLLLPRSCVICYTKQKQISKWIFLRSDFSFGNKQHSLWVRATDMSTRIILWPYTYSCRLGNGSEFNAHWRSIGPAFINARLRFEVLLFVV